MTKEEKRTLNEVARQLAREEKRNYEEVKSELKLGYCLENEEELNNFISTHFKQWVF